jgi:hypothetical protein
MSLHWYLISDLSDNLREATHSVLVDIKKPSLNCKTNKVIALNLKTTKSLLLQIAMGL